LHFYFIHYILYFYFGIKPSALLLPDKHSTSELHPQPYYYILKLQNLIFEKYLHVLLNLRCFSCILFLISLSYNSMFPYFFQSFLIPSLILCQVSCGYTFPGCGLLENCWLPWKCHVSLASHVFGSAVLLSLNLNLPILTFMDCFVRETTSVQLVILKLSHIFFMDILLYPLSSVLQGNS
jgi:hypothetical protein